MAYRRNKSLDLSDQGRKQMTNLLSYETVSIVLVTQLQFLTAQHINKFVLRVDVWWVVKNHTWWRWNELLTSDEVKGKKMLPVWVQSGCTE